jgi:hypothetical protein
VLSRPLLADGGHAGDRPAPVPRALSATKVKGTFAGVGTRAGAAAAVAAAVAAFVVALAAARHLHAARSLYHMSGWLKQFLGRGCKIMEEEEGAGKKERKKETSE